MKLLIEVKTIHKRLLNRNIIGLYLTTCKNNEHIVLN